MSEQSQRANYYSRVVANSENHTNHTAAYYSRNSFLRASNDNSNSNNTLGQIDVVMSVSANWSSKSTLAPISSNRYWRNRIAITLIPFVLSGAPVLHTLLQSDNYYEIDSTLKWLKSLLSTCILCPLNVILILVTLVINAWTFYLLVDIFISLFIFGQVPKNLMDRTYELIEILPIIMSIDLFWFKGYLLKDVINQFDYISLESAKMSPPRLTIKLFFIYSIISTLHIISYFTFRWRLKFGYTSESVYEYYEHLPHRILSTFLLPLYITFCSAVHYKNRCMNDYIRQLISNSEKPQILHFRSIKALYKRNSNLICRINTTFSLVMSGFFLVMIIGLVRDCIQTFYMVLAYTAFTKAMAKGSNMIESDFLKDMVRCTSADVLVIIIKLSLIGLTVMQMVTVNDESRSTPVIINDFVTQFNHEVPTSLYHSFRLLKYYVVSKMEKLNNPSLVTIMLFSNMPVIRSRLLARLPS